MHINYTCTVLSINEYTPSKQTQKTFFLMNTTIIQNMLNTYLREIYIINMCRISKLANFVYIRGYTFAPIHSEKCISEV